jgi:hypothetical protein
MAVIYSQVHSASSLLGWSIMLRDVQLFVVERDISLLEVLLHYCLVYPKAKILPFFNCFLLPRVYPEIGVYGVYDVRLRLLESPIAFAGSVDRFELRLLTSGFPICCSIVLHLFSSCSVYVMQLHKHACAEYALFYKSLVHVPTINTVGGGYIPEKKLETYLMPVKHVTILQIHQTYLRPQVAHSYV